MKKSLAGIRGAALMALAWGAAWAVVAVLVGLIVDPDGSMDEMWPAIGAYPGFLSAVVFSAMLALGNGRRGLGELPLASAGARGAVAGLLVGVLPFTIGEPTSAIPLWLLGAVVIGSITLLSAGSAMAWALLSRHAAGGRPPLGAGRPA